MTSTDTTPVRAQVADPAALRAVHSGDFLGLLRRLGSCWPGLINDDRSLLENSFVVPDAAIADVPAGLRAPADPVHRAAGLGGESDELGQEPDVRSITLYSKEIHIS
jgi:hypothetical protein